MSGLPTPRTTTEELLVALTLEVQGLRADIRGARGGEEPASGEPQVLTEPASKPGQSPARRPARRS